MNRRDLLKSVGGIGFATAAVGAGGFAAFGSSAAAQSGSSLNIGNSSVSNDDGDLSEIIVKLSHKAQWDNFDVGVDAVSYTDKISITDGSGNDRGSHFLLKNYVVDFEDDLDGDGTWGNNEQYNFNVRDEDNNANGPRPSVLDGSIDANITWTILIDPTATAEFNSVQTPAVIGQDVDDIDVDQDNTTVSYTIDYTKTVKFYKENSGGGYTQLGSDDGTLAETTAQGQFTVDVGNEEVTASSSGTGGSSAK